MSNPSATPRGTEGLPSSVSLVSTNRFPVCSLHLFKFPWERTVDGKPLRDNRLDQKVQCGSEYSSRVSAEQMRGDCVCCFLAAFFLSTGSVALVR
ncbi:hypothetical protein E2C01_058326 [Portunus trituberculatus]|uniref:Uncharacterized protein n=1 Tax=Portunus trituberculatus TaxID=210409 RepID=A0A5B7H3F4_PORTR|nr:hypothetical protein [Portunus trituberculatus]